MSKSIWFGPGHLRIGSDMYEPMVPFDMTADHLTKLYRQGLRSSRRLMTVDTAVSTIQRLAAGNARVLCERAGIDHSEMKDEDMRACLIAHVTGREAEVVEVDGPAQDDVMSRDDRRELVYALRVDGYTLEDIAAEVGVSVSTVRNDIALMSESDAD